MTPLFAGTAWGKSARNNVTVTLLMRWAALLWGSPDPENYMTVHPDNSTVSCLPASGNPQKWF